ncbi:MAG: 3'(2'),5'-bisphosphate nucleotidase CysQ [Phyllobacteriaceae bacterium]|nr:3'(2'),5'-bisphosphate nucleotidase CysQ [Phyllobacteriaceae bacterium]
MTFPVPSPNMLVLLRLARAAAREIMAIYGSDFAVRNKADLSPVTEADEKAEQVILAGLREHFPDVPVVAEEQAAAGVVPVTAEDFFLVDPLDGTKEFLSRNGEFTVNIARIRQGVPAMGVVYAPAAGAMYWGESGTAAHAEFAIDDSLEKVEWKICKVRPAPAAGLTVIASRSHRDTETDAYLAQVKVAKLISAGSSLKFCKVACGSADLYPRFGRTMEWDTAAGQAVLEAAGGKVLDTSGEPLRYGKRQRGFDNPGFIASA